VTALGHSVGDPVSAGTVLGFEGDVGQASGPHVHLEVGIPDDVLNPLDGGGFLRGQSYVPLICGVPGNVLYDGEIHTANPC
jgi:murein DD-endopeptidase MepM/ murein hydrolase activator NlpD